MSEETKSTNKKERIRSTVTLILLIASAAIATVALWPYISSLATEEGRERLMSFIDGLGAVGWLVTLAIQVLQILLAFLPGEPVEIMLGAVWGPWLGTLTCLFGVLIGTVLVYLLAKWLGKPFVHLVVGDKDAKRYRFLSDPTKLDITVFILFFIPGTPKDALTYLVPLTPISPLRYFLIATFARIPSIVTSTILGDSILRGDYVGAVIVFAVTAVISVAGIIFGERYMKKRAAETDNGSDE